MDIIQMSVRMRNISEENVGCLCNVEIRLLRDTEDCFPEETTLKLCSLGQEGVRPLLLALGMTLLEGRKLGKWRERNVLGVFQRTKDVTEIEKKGRAAVEWASRIPVNTLVVTYMSHTAVPWFESWLRSLFLLLSMCTLGDSRWCMWVSVTHLRDPN